MIDFRNKSAGLNRVVGLSATVVKGTNGVRMSADVHNTGGIDANFMVVFSIKSGSTHVFSTQTTKNIPKGNIGSFTETFDAVNIATIADGTYDAWVGVYSSGATTLYDEDIKPGYLVIVSPTGASLSNFQVEVVF